MVETLILKARGGRYKTDTVICPGDPAPLLKGMLSIRKKFMISTKEKLYNLTQIFVKYQLLLIFFENIQENM